MEKSGTQTSLIWRKLKRNRMALFGGGILSILLFVAAAGPWLAPYNPIKQDLRFNLETPSSKNLLGRDELGRDILSRILSGTRISIGIAICAVGVGLLIGVPLGLISGFWGGKVDFLLQRVTDTMLAFPGFLLALAMVSVMGVGFKNVVISIGISSVPIYIRLVRGCVLSIREQAYVEAARALGTRNLVILYRHILINVMVPIIVQSTLGMGTAILHAAGLGFLGLGVQPPTAEWGAMLGSGRSYLFNTPHVATFPGLAIFFAVLGFNLFGDGLRDALDPRFKSK
jgi:ABC-type dipeptide/oligopeptide/nickel transport system permease subunit